MDWLQQQKVQQMHLIKTPNLSMIGGDGEGAGCNNNHSSITAMW